MVTILVHVAIHWVSVRPSLTGPQVVEKVSGSHEVRLVTSKVGAALVTGRHAPGRVEVSHWVWGPVGIPQPA